ncbi:MAG: DNA mismatch repair endonuclease MutL [Marinifilaceae bacterium]
MANIIQLLPDAVANQIAAGEVVQRPASVVKELVENSVDAGATTIQVILKNAGKTSIQVIDNGKGLSPMDARMAFERHATSKIAAAQDLFNIRTLGFRGEALPSIASVAEVELRSRETGEELGTYIYISESTVKKQEPVNCAEGTNIIVSNLFFNVPARRKFLKADSTEFKNVVTEFLRIALTNPDVSFTLIHNDKTVYQLPASQLRQRVVNVMGKAINSKLINVECDTELIKVRGYVCTPQHAKKTYGEQYFFVNNRFMKHNFFHKAIVEAYSGLIAGDMIPSYFLYFTINPDLIDVNIHPTKTEIKFQDEPAIFQILLAGVKEMLGKCNIMPPLDFDTEGSIQFETPTKPASNYIPRVQYNPSYNPFNYHSTPITPTDSSFDPGVETTENAIPSTPGTSWRDFFVTVEETPQPQQTVIEEFIEQEQQQDATPAEANFMQVKNRYILTSTVDGFMAIDQRRAYERILFEQYLEAVETTQTAKQKCLFPETIDLTPEDFTIAEEIVMDLDTLGFELTQIGPSSFAIYATPADLNTSDAAEVLQNLIEYYKETSGDIKVKDKERVALAMAKAASGEYVGPLNDEEMRALVDTLFACRNYSYTADGKVISFAIGLSDILGWFR